MKHFLRTPLCGAAAFALLAGVTSTRAASVTIDDFEGYTNNQQLSASTSSTPWLRSGSIADNLFASNAAASLLDGTLSARIPVAIAAAGGSVTIRRNYVSATDFSAYTSASVLSKSLSTPSTATLQLSIANATTSYFTTLAQLLSPTATTFTFSLAPGSFTLAGGTDSFASVLGSTTAIGFRIGSTTGSTNETIAFDDFTLQNSSPASVPLPAALPVAGVIGLIGTQLRRKRA